ncbi:hypothetical protein [Micromonospora cathayae]|uniref:Ig-like domain-containing protein n=1 Tax=Micromonospora cathayae TaxID=3028804 RepID=A0ABY7ZPC6_9ACTN|nr:hypothetical protein [Micromonospora sp. HUAS 3]WDZ84281.1 hypothetical protein PVK37_28125 [Micromonospora sp. HUAS 3]
MSPHQVLSASRPHRRPPALLLVLGLVLGLVVPTVAATPAHAGPVVQTPPYCTSSAFYAPNPANPLIGTNWTLIGSRSNSGHSYRYWMAQEATGSVLYYQSSLVAQCSASDLVSSTTLTATAASGTAYCTSFSDLTSSSVVERYVGQRWVPTRGITPTATFRYWHREWFSYATLTYVYDSSYVARC